MNDPESTPSPSPADLDQLGRIAGLAALSTAASDLGRPLAPIFNAYSGSMFVSGRVAPPSWLHAVSRKGWERDLTASVLKRMRKSTEAEQREEFRSLNQPYLDSYRQFAASEDERYAVQTELTLVDAVVYPAVGADGTKSGGHQLPVVRLPISSVNLWWFVDGAEIRASSGWSGSFGILFPID